MKRVIVIALILSSSIFANSTISAEDVMDLVGKCKNIKIKQEIPFPPFIINTETNERAELQTACKSGKSINRCPTKDTYYILQSDSLSFDNFKCKNK